MFKKLSFAEMQITRGGFDGGSGTVDDPYYTIDQWGQKDYWPVVN